MKFTLLLLILLILSLSAEDSGYELNYTDIILQESEELRRNGVIMISGGAVALGSGLALALPYASKDSDGERGNSAFVAAMGGSLSVAGIFVGILGGRSIRESREIIDAERDRQMPLSFYINHRETGLSFRF